jgi:hypothetical protein
MRQKLMRTNAILGMKLFTVNITEQACLLTDCTIE